MANDQLSLDYEPISFADMVAADALLARREARPDALREFLRDLASDNTFAVVESRDAAL